ncbi:SusC/RagA family TonB-linked outer membrane protein [Flavilitoribacter nigricans]|uniref:SusC/RagA family TonB-linked outer membrane protein n=1 Tax=Flavilitoribacter nigricans (strain ATCC 23147 / DSM 23189 / NBRC 102662 / NCIMB 1420 / SS-2) TaxID=1122177 RepID=A0A2D0MY54_FLAN2|nr:TonB-dependent receptor [Flavilitoribacter nigricans]PHN01056.1 SusC/RagA family TonB-linked outer membrane protein [Flavilitoribacter nigricans DSM 23189 = NBRC 102662]
MKIPVLFLLALLPLWGLTGQDLTRNFLVANNDHNYIYVQPSSATENAVYLVDALKTLQKQYRVYFTYSNEIVNRQKVVFPNERSTSLEDKLQQMLHPLRLRFKKVRSNIFVITDRESELPMQTEILSDRKEAENQPEYRSKFEPVVPLKNARKTHVKLLEFPVSGVVMDNDGVPLIGVNVMVKGTAQGTITDVDGRFSLDVLNGNETLVFSYIGFETMEMPISRRSELTVTMLAASTSLDEIVVVGYGSMKKSDLTGAVSSISSEDLAESPASNLIEQSQGRLAGVDIVKSDGSPGSNTQIRIRGNRSINASNEPLFVIDGIPTTLSINDFNPNDIASIEVLKDASAVAIYGSRGANGVVLITTKRGKAGKGTVSYNGYYGFKEPYENIDVMNAQEYARFARVANGVDPNDASQDASFLGPVLAENIQQGISTNWLDEVLQTGTQQDHQLAFSGGTQGLRYYISGGYYDEEGVIRKSDYTRYSIRANLDADLSPKLNVGISSTANSDVRNVMSNNPYEASLRYVPIVEPYDADGNIIAFPNPNEGLLRSPLTQYAPGQWVNETKGYRVFTNLYGEYKLLPRLSYRLNFGTDLSTARRGTYTGDLDGDAPQGAIRNTQTFAYTIENILTYEQTVGDHNFNIVGLFSTQENNFESSNLSARGIPIGRSTFNALGSAAEITGIDSDLSEWGLLSYMGRINYRFKDRYLLTASGRADGSSRLAEGNKWAFFPAISAGWIVSEEGFMQNGPFSFLKLRLSYGEVGNTSINPFQTLGGLARTTYAFGNDEAFGFGQSEIANPDLKWEVSKTYNIGLDFGFFNNRLSGTLEIYNTDTEDLLLSRLLPITSGFGSVLQNIGSTRNRGWELTLSANIMDRPNSGFQWDMDFNVFSNNEEIIELFNGLSDDVGNQWFIGSPINVFYDFAFDGIWQADQADAALQYGQQPGDIRIQDVNGRGPDGELTKQPDGVINNDDRTILGSTVPDWSGGINTRIGFKGIDLAVLVYARQGQLLSSNFHNLSGNRWEGRYSAFNLNYYSPDNPTNDVPQPRAGGQPLYQSSIRYFDGSFVKIRSITLGYSLPKGIASKMGMSSLRLYGQATNPIIFSKYDIVDPETSNGVVGGNSPLTSSTFLFGVNVKF